MPQLKDNMPDFLCEVRYGYISSVARVNRALKKKIFKGYFLEVTELDATQRKELFSIHSKLSFSPGRHIGGLPDPFTGKLITQIPWMTDGPTPAHADKTLFRVELWRTK
jgi:hypothetical protein